MTQHDESRVLGDPCTDGTEGEGTPVAEDAGIEPLVIKSLPLPTGDSVEAG